MAEKTNAAKLHSKLLLIQQELVVTKDQVNKDDEQNTFRFRSAEQILAAAKPILDKVKATLTLSDEVEFQGGRVYIKSTATLFDTETGESVSCTALARESEKESGMSASQLTGSTSSYARKYALGGLFLLDDNKDPDSGRKAESDEGVVNPVPAAPEAEAPAPAKKEEKVVIGKKPEEPAAPKTEEKKPAEKKPKAEPQKKTAAGNLAKALGNSDAGFEITRAEREKVLEDLIGKDGIPKLLNYFKEKKGVDAKSLADLSDEQIDWAIETKRSKIKAPGEEAKA